MAQILPIFNRVHPCDLANILTKFHEDWAIFVASRV